MSIQFLISASSNASPNDPTSPLTPVLPVAALRKLERSLYGDRAHACVVAYVRRDSVYTYIHINMNIGFADRAPPPGVALAGDPSEFNAVESREISD